MFLVSFVLFAIFLVLKLTKYIAWAWVWVASPLWIGAILYVIYFLLSWLVFNKTYKTLFGENTAYVFGKAWASRKK